MSRPTLSPARLLTLALAGACGVLVLVLAGQRWLAGGGSEVDAIQVSAFDAAAPSSLETRRFELPSRSEYAEVTARPLFNEDRRPAEQSDMEQPDEALVAEQSPAELPPVSLTGVIITPEQRIAMLQNTKNREYVTLKEGEPLEGWTLEEVSRRRIVFSTGAERQVVELEVYTGNLGGGRSRGGSRGDRAGSGGNGDQAGEDQAEQAASATEQIRERIQRERERRRELIEEARKRSRERNADSDQ